MPTFAHSLVGRGLAPAAPVEVLLFSKERERFVFGILTLLKESEKSLAIFVYRLQRRRECDIIGMLSKKDRKQIE